MAFKNGMRPVHPGKVLREEYLKPLELSAQTRKAVREIKPREECPRACKVCARKHRRGRSSLSGGAIRPVGVLAPIPYFGSFEAILSFLLISGYSVGKSYLSVERLDVPVSMCPFSEGFPGRMKSSFRPRRYAHSSSAREVNSVP
jgi:hypothetical protein